MAIDPLRKQPGKGRPEIWASGGQRPPFDLRALWRATVHLARDAVVPLHAWAARRTRQVAINVKNGAGRIPAGKLGRAERFVPSHLRVAGWIKNVAATLSHAGATADQDIKRGNALVAEIEPHLWDDAEAPVVTVDRTPAPSEPAPADPGRPPDVPPVILAEPEAPDADPLASIREEMAGNGKAVPPRASHPVTPASPPAPPGPVATAVIQVTGYLLGWASVGIALPYGMGRALWLWLNGRDLKGIGREE
jgi:hypothetical protein